MSIIIGILLLVLSGINVSLPDVGNLFDIWRILFSIVAFSFGWWFLLKGIADNLD